MELKNRAKIYRRSENQAIELLMRIFENPKCISNRGVFDWLRGDKGTKLRVDAFFPDQKLVFEYQGSQHYRPNRLMDRRPGRAEQRRRYTDLRRRLVAKHDLKFLELKYNEPLEEQYIRGKLRDIGYKV